MWGPRGGGFLMSEIPLYVLMSDVLLAGQDEFDQIRAAELAEAQHRDINGRSGKLPERPLPYPQEPPCIPTVLPTVGHEPAYMYLQPICVYGLTCIWATRNFWQLVDAVVWWQDEFDQIRAAELAEAQRRWLSYICQIDCLICLICARLTVLHVLHVLHVPN